MLTAPEAHRTYNFCGERDLPLSNKLRSVSLGRLSDQNSKFYVAIFTDAVFVDESVELDDKQFIRCVFINCILECRGGDIVFDRSEMKGCRHVFYGRARQTLHYLQNVGLIPFNPAEWSEFSNQVH